jgi:trehalose 6-phosphate phosphatase
VVVRRLGSGWAAVACFGDDLGDLPAFAALDDLAAGGVVVARVAVVDAESPPEVAAAADVVVAGPAGAVTLLRQLVDGHEPSTGKRGKNEL